MIPPRRILAATDFSDASRAAVIFAGCLAKQCDATFHLLHAEDPLLSAGARQAGFDLNHDTREALREFAASVRPMTNDASVHHVVIGSAADVIIDVARHEKADLIVIGSHGMSGAERLMFGSTAERVLRHATTSVLVVPPGWAPLHPAAADLSGTGPIVAGIDFSTTSIEAAAAACSLAAALATTVEAVHIVPGLPVLQRWQAHADRAVSEGIETARGHLASAVLGLGATVPVTTHVEAGRVPERLAALAASTRNRHPMLVLGRRPGRLGSAPGSIAYRALTLAAVPVLMYVPEIFEQQR